MSGLVTRLRRRRPAATVPVPQAPPGPAGLEPQDPVAVPEPGFRDRGRLRRRLRHLRRVRELGFRDLGGLVFDLHRFGRPGQELVAQKLAALTAVDQELRALERALADERPFHELREPGISACPRCAAIHGSDARYCPSCGIGLHGPLAVGEVGDAPAGAVTPPLQDRAVPAATPSPASPPPAPDPVTSQTQVLPVADAETPESSADEPAVPAPSSSPSEDDTVVERPGDREA